MNHIIIFLCPEKFENDFHPALALTVLFVLYQTYVLSMFD